MNGWQIGGIVLGITVTAAYLIWKILYFHLQEQLKRELRDAV